MAKNNLFVFFMSSSLCFAVLLLFPDVMFAAASDVAQAYTGKEWRGLAYLSAALAVGLACLGSAFAVARIGSAGLGAISEKPELTGRVLVFLGLAEGIAIYGLIIAIMILNKL
ncbi:MAG: ATPase [Planctomycetaceae bacterium]|nr:MAG: ATPase [Planctomycetaceae bacterium]